MDGSSAARLRAALGGLVGAVALVLLAGVGLGSPADRLDGAGAAEAAVLAADATPPTLSPVVERPVVPRHGTVVARAGAADALSGLQSQGCVTGRGRGTRTLGLHTMTCTATDRAGNRAWKSVSYRVVERRR